jgi:hypothetical protein
VGLSRLLRHAACRADAAVFCVAGSTSRDTARLLRLAEGIHLTTTPRAANILVIVGELDAGLVAPAHVAHDALASPRATVWWRLVAPTPLARTGFPDALVVNDPDPIPALREVHERLVTGRREGEAAMLPNVEPAPWRDIGPYGQGGKGMTGGVPYGRPMAERADDRDGLKLDYLPVRVGPLFSAFPAGLGLDLKLQGDVIQEAVLENHAAASTRAGSLFHHALRMPVAIRDLELARARSHLRWLSDAVAVAGPASLAERVLRLAQRIAPGDGDAIRALERVLARRGFFSWGGSGIGVLPPRLLTGVSGPIARASGLPIDARSKEPAYQRLGFEAIVHDRADAAARWLQRIREASQALDLAQRAGDAHIGGSGIIEAPRGSLSEGSLPSQAIARLVPSFVAGMEWGEAVAAIVSLDLDMSEAHAVAGHASAAS